MQRMNSSTELSRAWGQNIRDRRLELGRTLRWLADEVGVTEGTASRWELGKVMVLDHHKVAVANALDTGVRDLFPLEETSVSA